VGLVDIVSRGLLLTLLRGSSAAQKHTAIFQGKQNLIYSTYSSGVVSGTTVRALVLGRFSQKN